VNPDCQTDIEPDNKPDTKKPKRKCLIVILIAAALWGFLEGILPEDSQYIQMVDVMISLLLSLLVLIWCLLDSEEWNFKISLKLSIVIFLLWVVGIPYYIFQTRKGRTALVTLCLSVLFLFMVSALYCCLYWVGGRLSDWIYIY
jgi:hypothetical protein